MNERSFIAIGNDLESLHEDLKKRFQAHRIVSFFEDSFLLEHVKAVLKEAYIAENKTKILILGALEYTIVAQNSLLKILEEPPECIQFILCATSKLAFLPTIRSRLYIEDCRKKVQQTSCGLNFEKIDLKEIFTFLKDLQDKQNLKDFSKEDLKILISSITKEAFKNNIALKSEDLEYFEQLFKLACLNAKASNILTAQLIRIIERKKA